LTEDASAGRLYADVVADTTGFRKDAERKLKTALKDLKVKARVDVTYSTTQARAALNATLREVARDDKLKAIRAKVDFDPGQIRRALNTALKTASADANPIRVKVEADTSTARRQIRDLERGNPVVKVDTEARTVTVEKDIDQMRQRQSSRPIDIPVRADANSLSRVSGALTGLLKLPVIADGAIQLAGALFSVASSASQAVGVLAALPNLAGVAVQGIGALVLGFSGIGDAVKAMGKAQTAAGTQATKSAGQQAAAAEAVRSAQERLARAQEQAAERVAEARKRLARTVEQAADQQVQAERRVVQAQADGARRVEAAERQVIASHQARTQALIDLKAATEAAIEKQEDLALALSGAALDEEGAQIALERAKARLEQITGVGSTATPLDKREADLEYRQAIQRLKEVQERNGDLAQEKAESDRKGIQGSDEVVAAQQRVTEATQAEIDAQRNLAQTRADVASDIADAQRELAKTRRDNAREIADAQADVVKAQRDGARAVADAQHDLARALKPATSAATGQAAAFNALDAAMAKLSPEGRAFAKFVKGTLEPRFRSLRNAVQAALLPQIQKAITLGMPLLNTLQKGLVSTADRVGVLAVKLGKLFGSKAFNKDVSSIMASNNRALSSFGDAMVPLFKILSRVAKVAGPILVEPFADWIKQLTIAAEKSDKLSESRIADFLERSAAAAKKLGKIFKNVVKGIANIARAARPAGDTLLDDLVDASEKFAKWAGDSVTQKKIKDFFDRLTPVIEKLGKFLKRVTDLLGSLQEAGGGKALDGFLSTMETVVGLLQRLMNIPGVAPVVGALLTLSGVGLALGLVGAAVGGIVKNLGRLAKITGLKKLLGGITGSFNDMGDAIDKELPKDKKKSDAIKDVGEKADTTKTKAKDLGKGVDDLGKSAAKSAKKSSKLSGALGKVGGAASTALGKVNGLIGIGGGGEGGKTVAKGGKVKAAVKGGGGLLALTGLLFGQDIADAVSGGETGTPRAVAGSALSSGLTGAGIGSFLGGPIGGLIAGLYSASFGAVDEGGGNIKAAGIGSLAGLPGLFLAGFANKIPDLAKKARPEIDKLLGEFDRFKKDLPDKLQQTWKDVVNTVPGLAGLGALPLKAGEILGQGKAKFAEFKKSIPAAAKGAWQGVLGSIPALGPLTGGVGAILAGTGKKFDDVRKKAPETLSKAWLGAVATVPGLGPLTGGVGSILTNTGKKFDNLKAAIPGVLSKGWAGALGTIKGGLGPIVGSVGSVLSGTEGKFSDLKAHVPGILKQGWQGVLGTVPSSLKPLPAKVGEVTSDSQKKFEDLKTKAPQTMTSGWRGVLGTIPALKPLANKVGEITSGVVDWFKKGVDGAKKNWDRLPAVTGGPIKTVANTVYNNGLVKVWNSISSKIPGFAGLVPIKLGFARGGILPGTSSYRNGDDQLVPMRRGEGVYVSEAMRSPYERARLHAVNQAAMRGQSLDKFQGFAQGGIFDGIGGFLTAAKDAFTGGLKKALSGALDPILSSVTSSLGGSPYGQMIAGGARLLASKVIDRIMGFEDQLVGGDATGVAKAAASMIGRGDDRGPNNNWLTRAWGMPGAPWCAMFVSEAIKQAKATKKYPGYPTAAVYGYYSRMKKVPGDTARPGDLGVYNGNSGHINVIEKNLGQGNYQTIGGNENSVVRRGRRVGAYAILRPEGKALGGLIDQRAFREKNLGYDHDQRDPLFRLLARLSPSVAMSVSNALSESKWVQRDSGGPLYPGMNAVVNNTGGLEWVLTPEAVRLLGGPAAVQALNDRARVSSAGRAGRATAMARTSGATTSAVTQNIYPQPRQSEQEIAMISIRKIGAVLGH